MGSGRPAGGKRWEVVARRAVKGGKVKGKRSQERARMVLRVGHPITRQEFAAIRVPFPLPFALKFFFICGNRRERSESAAICVKTLKLKCSGPTAILSPGRDSRPFPCHSLPFAFQFFPICVNLMPPASISAVLRLRKRSASASICVEIHLLRFRDSRSFACHSLPFALNPSPYPDN